MTPEAIAARTAVQGECRVWMSARDKDGYGQTTQVDIDGRHRNVRVHRMVWSHANGPIPVGMSVLHRCDNRPCVRLDHLYLGTVIENTLDRVQRGRSAHPTWLVKATLERSAAITECPKGHPYDEKNTYRKAGTGRRQCRACRAQCEDRRRRRLERETAA